MESIARKGDITYNKQFLLFSQCFLPYMVLIFCFKCTSKCRLQFVSIWAILKFCHLVMGEDLATSSASPLYLLSCKGFDIIKTL